jgi:GDP-L-fucose synthase
VYLAAARVGGIHANNTYPDEFIYNNLMVQNSIIHQAFLNGVKKLLFLGSSCIYPRLALQPMSEDTLLTGKLEPTNELYVITKIAGIKMCESYNRQYGASHGVDYRSVMPANLYSPGDNCHPENVILALIKRFHEAKIAKTPEVVTWGTGKPKHDFLYVDDMAAASVFVMELDKAIYDQHIEPMHGYINAGFGSDITIAELAQVVYYTVGFKGKIGFDASRPGESPRKWMDSSRINGPRWAPNVALDNGINQSYQSFLRSQ